MAEFDELLERQGVPPVLVPQIVQIERTATSSVQVLARWHPSRRGNSYCNLQFFV